MKKIFAFALALVMVLSLAACGGKDAPKPSGSDKPDTSQQEPASSPAPSTSKPEEPPSGGNTGDKTAAEHLEHFDLSAIEIPTDKVSNISDYTAATDKDNVEIIFQGIEADEFSAMAESVFNALSAKGAVTDKYDKAITSYEEALGGMNNDYYGFKAAGYEVSISYYPEAINTFQAKDLKLGLKRD